MAITSAHLIFTCLIKHPLSGPPLAPLLPMLRKCKHRGLRDRNINHPGLAKAPLCPHHPGHEAEARPCQVLIRCCCCWALPGCLHQKFPQGLGTEVVSTRPYHSERGDGGREEGKKEGRVNETSHFKIREAEAQRGKKICPRSHSKTATKSPSIECLNTAPFLYPPSHLWCTHQGGLSWRWRLACRELGKAP